FEDLPRFAHSVDALQRNPERVVGACEARVNLTPEWGLPPFQIAQQFVNAGAPGKAIPYLEKAVSFNPRSVINRWNLVHVLRRATNPGRGERESAELIRLDPNYAQLAQLRRDRRSPRPGGDSAAVRVRVRRGRSAVKWSSDHLC